MLPEFGVGPQRREPESEERRPLFGPGSDPAAERRIQLLRLNEENPAPPSACGPNLLRQESCGAREASGPGLVAPRARPLPGGLAGGRDQLDQAVGEDWCVKVVGAEDGGGGGGAAGRRTGSRGRARSPRSVGGPGNGAGGGTKGVDGGTRVRGPQRGGQSLGGGVGSR